MYLYFQVNYLVIRSSALGSEIRKINKAIVGRTTLDFFATGHSLAVSEKK